MCEKDSVGSVGRLVKSYNRAYYFPRYKITKLPACGQQLVISDTPSGEKKIPALPANMVTPNKLTPYLLFIKLHAFQLHVDNNDNM